MEKILTLQEYCEKECKEHLNQNELNEMAVHRIDDSTYSFDFENDRGGIVNLCEPELLSNDKFGYVYKFGYKFNADVSKSLQLEFIRKLKGIQNFKDNNEFRKFLLKPLKLLDKYIRHIWNIDICLFPQSRSSINLEMTRHLSNIARSKPFISFEMFKQNMQNIKFDFQRYLDDNYKIWITDIDKQRAIKRAEDYIARVKTRDYFSIARIDGKYKKYFTSFLKCNSEKLENIIRKKENMNILILDDISTTGTTILETIDYIYTFGGEHTIFIFTIIDN